MASLTPITENIWTVPTPHKMMGLHLGTRMTVVKLSSGDVLLHSPIAIDNELQNEISHIGTVKHIICPNMFHHSYANDAAKVYPNATLHGSTGLQKKRPDVRFGAVLTESPHSDWASDLEQIFIEGCDLKETVFFHKKTKTVISADLSENFQHMPHTPTRLYLQVSGVYQRPGWSKLLRFVYKDKAKARRSIEQVLQWDFERAIISHGDLLTRDAKQAIRQTFEWL
jgi:hypothetical protein